jgi:hypothetical protein
MEQYRSGSVITLGIKEPRVATQVEIPKGIPPITLLVVMETTLMHTLRMQIVGAIKGTIVGVVSPLVIAIRVPSIARARTQLGAN